MTPGASEMRHPAGARVHREGREGEEHSQALRRAFAGPAGDPPRRIPVSEPAQWHKPIERAAGQRFAGGSWGDKGNSPSARALPK